MCIRSIVFFLLSLSSLLGIAQELKQGESGSLLRIESFPAASKNDNPKLFCPLALLIGGGSGKIVVKNISPSKILQNIRTTFSSSGELTTYVTESTDCPTSLQPGASCNFIYTPNGTPFSSGTIFVSGSFKILADGTVGLSTGIIISSLPQISFSGSATTTSIIDVSNGSTTLTVSNNNTTAFHAKDVTVTNQSGCSTVAVDASQCTDIAPGSSCPLTLTTGVSGTPYTPCTLTITGSNTSNSITALVAFRDMGGLVFATSGLCNGVPASEKIAFVNTFEQFFSEWTLFNTTNGAVSNDDGLFNTGIITADSNCNSFPFNCAAFACSNNSPGWYLPAVNELTEIHNSFCSNNAFPCNFGTFDSFGAPYWYWSSTVVPADIFADILIFPNGTTATLNQTVKAAVVCSQCFP